MFRNAQYVLKSGQIFGEGIFKPKEKKNFNSNFILLQIDLLKNPVS